MNIAWHLGLFAFVLMALAGANLDIPEPYRTWIAIGGIVGTAISGYLAKFPRDPSARERRGEPESKE
jgi:hypothetical protein